MNAANGLWNVAALSIERIQRMSAAEIAVNLGVSALIGITALAVALCVRWLVRRLQSNTERLGRQSTVRRLSQLAQTFTAALQAICAVAAIVLIGRVWGYDLAAWASSGPGAALVAVVLRLGLLAAIAVAAFELSSLFILRGMSRIAESSRDLRRQAQVRTLGALLAAIARTVVVITFLLMALGEIGVNVGPLLAGAGVAGVALGFGAQTIVKDLLTGLFLVIEDIVSVGDIVRIGDSGGLVERMTLRTIRLRDFDGTLHVFPYGEAQVVHNLTKTFSCYAFNLQVSYTADLDHAMEVMRQVGGELQADPELGPAILEPIEIAGVDSLADSGVVLKARVKTVPMKQWAVGREFNRRIKLAFDREGIEIPYPHMKLVLPGAAGAPANEA